MYWYDGELINSETIQLNISEPGLCYGASVFTTVRVYELSLNHSMTCWQAHCDRLQSSIKKFDWQQPDWQKLRAGAEQLLVHHPVLRMAVFPNGKEWIIGRDLPADLKHRQNKGIAAWVASDNLYRRELALYKTGNYLGAYLARDRALNLNAQEAILIDRQGNWLETSTGNLWGWRDGGWYTPSLDSGILPGIKRAYILDFLKKSNISVRENIWNPEFVLTLEALFYSNCVVEMVPIIQVSNLGNITNYPHINFSNINHNKS